MIDSETDEIIDELFKPLFQRYQKRLEESFKGSEFIFDSVNLLRHHLQITSLKKLDRHIYILHNG